MKPTRFRVARPTDQMPRIKTFYIEGLGLTERGSFQNHDGYDGIILGIDESSYEIEFTTHLTGSPCHAPSQDNLLVFYLRDAAAVAQVVLRMSQLGIEPVVPENPYWITRASTFEDADGWRVAIVNSQALNS
ncbi:MAG: VOC family protein [Planctomycetes bacterium]|nr:VOC family protein [Planctomycetota bacterium]